MYRVEGDIIHGVYKCLIFVVRNGITSMAFKRKVAPEASSDLHGATENKLAVNPSPQHTLMQLKYLFAGELDDKTYWIATLPSTLPTAKPLLMGDVVKQETTRVCHFKGDMMV